LFFEESLSDYSGSNALVVSSHPLIEKKGQAAPIIGAGHLMPENDMRSLLESLLDKLPQHNRIIPANVLSMSSNHLAWTVKGSVKPMYFKLRGASKGFKINVPYPTLLFVANQRGLSIAALKSNRRPTEKTKLFHAPLMNIYKDATVCLGDSSMPTDITPSTQEEIEALIFKTNFSHINHEKTLNNKQEISDKKHLAFWRQLAKAKATKFPTANLSSLDITVNDLIQRAVR